jgi:hypothetical protein
MNCWRGTRRRAPKIIGRDGARPSLSKRCAAIVFALAIVDLTGCALLPRHPFVEPARDWQTRTGQLMYRAPKTRIIGEVFVRFSKNGDFELIFSKGPGVNLLILKQNNSFAEVKGALARLGWSGPVNRAPRQLRGWLELRDQFIHSLATGRVRPTGGQDRQSLRHVTGKETFVFRF